MRLSAVLLWCFRDSYVAGQISLGLGGEEGEGVQTQFKSLLPLLLPAAFIHFLQRRKEFKVLSLTGYYKKKLKIMKGLFTSK